VSSLGGLGDSFYEYILKIWHMTGKQVNGYRRMYDQAIDPVMRKMLYHAGGLTFLVELHAGRQSNKMEHLACFAGGMFALGAVNQNQMDLAKGITESCHEMYKRSPTGLSPEAVYIAPDGTISPVSSYYILRPETMEGFFYLWRTTHDPKYRDWGWEAFSAIQKYCRVEAGFSGVRDVTNTEHNNYDDLQQTFLLAETFKYLYLLFSDDDVVSLDKYVFNTEAHPLPIFSDVNSWSAEWFDMFPPPTK